MIATCHGNKPWQTAAGVPGTSFVRCVQIGSTCASAAGETLAFVLAFVTCKISISFSLVCAGYADGSLSSLNLFSV